MIQYLIFSLGSIFLGIYIIRKAPHMVHEKNEPFDISSDILGWILIAFLGLGFIALGVYETIILLSR